MVPLKHNKLLELKKQNTIATNAWLAIPNAWTAELIANVGFDACTIDLQHGLADYQIALTMLQSINSSGNVPLVRVPWNEPSLVMKMLDAGALGVIVPMIDNQKQIRHFIDACKYPPLGSRSFGPIRASLTLGKDYFQEANNEILAIAMIETREGLKNIEDIANVEGLNGFYIGTMDLSISLGLKSLGDLHDAILMSAIEKILDIAKEQDLLIGIHSKSLEETEILRDLGVNIITPINDSTLLQTSALSIYNQTKTLLSK